MKSFESFSENISIGNKIYTLIDSIYSKSKKTFGAHIILSGDLKIYQHDKIKNGYMVTIFNISFTILKQNNKIIISDVNSSDFENIYQNLVILSNFDKLNYMKDSKQLSIDIDRFLDTYEEDYPENFYIEYFEYFEDSPEALKIIDFPKEELDKNFNTEQKNLLKSLQVSNKYKLFGE